MSIRGQKVQVQREHTKENKMEMQASLHNRFDVEVLRPDGTVDQYVGYNIILDALWTRIGTNAAWFAAIAYGSGTGTLSASRTDLFTRIGAKTAGAVTEDFSHFGEGYITLRRMVQLDAGELTGQTLREVGIAYDTSAGHQMTHAQLKDMNGNVVSIAIGSLDVVKIYATVYVRFAASGYKGGGVFYTPERNAYAFLKTVAGCGDTSITGCLGVFYGFMGEPFQSSPVHITGSAILNYSNPQGLLSLKKLALVSYNSGTRKILSRISLAAGSSYRLGISEMNSPENGGINGFSLGYSVGDYGYFTGICIKFPNTAKPYCTITDESIGTGDGSTREFTTKFGFILNDGSAVLKAGGVTVPSGDYSIDYGKPAHNKIGYFLRRVGGNRIYWNKPGSTSGAAGDYDIVENPLYAAFGITGLTKCNGLRLDCSNDLTNWVTDVYGSLATYKNYRYWRVYAPSAFDYQSDAAINVVSSDIPATTVHFTAGKAPASGAALTLSYRTASLAKDSNHVVDLELEVSLNEYTG